MSFLGISIPGINLPDVKLPDVKLPEVKLPGISLPKLDPPKITISPSGGLNLNLPKFDLLKSIPIPKVGIPAVDKVVENTVKNIDTAKKEMEQSSKNIGNSAVKIITSATRGDIDGMADSSKDIGRDLADIRRNTLNLTPIGTIVNAATDNGLNKGLEQVNDVSNRIIDGVIDGTADDIKMVKSGGENIGAGIVSGNPNQILEGVMQVGIGGVSTVSDFTPKGIIENIALSTINVASNSILGNPDTIPEDVDSEVTEGSDLIEAEDGAPADLASDADQAISEDGLGVDSESVFENSYGTPEGADTEATEASDLTEAEDATPADLASDADQAMFENDLDTSSFENASEILQDDTGSESRVEMAEQNSPSANLESEAAPDEFEDDLDTAESSI